MPSWVQHLSYGGLIQPSTEWLNKVHTMNKHFLKYNGKKQQFKKREIVVTNLVERISRKEDIPVHLVHTFVKLRTIIRINRLKLKK